MVQGPRIEIISTDKEFDMVFHIPKLILGLCQNEKTTVSTCKSEFFKFSGIDLIRWKLPIPVVVIIGAEVPLAS